MAFVTVGIVAVALLMMGVAYCGMRWSVVGVVLVGVVLGGVAAGRVPADRPAGSRRSEVAIAIFAILLVAWIVIGGAATSFDALLFWGAKGQQFGVARTIDVGFLRAPEHYLMHPDYPPLVPLLYACTMIGSDRLNWFVVILSSPLFLALATCAVWAFRPRLTAVFATMFGFLFVLNSVGGNAEPALIFFETVALVSDDDLLTSCALTGAALTKFEGGVFAVVFVIVTKRLLLGALPAAALGSWIAFVRVERITEAYAGTMYGPFSTAHLGTVVRELLHEAAFGVAFIPWIVAAVFLVKSRNRLPALVIAAVMIAFFLFVYARAGDTTTLLLSSAKRVLLTPLLALLLPVEDRPPRVALGDAHL